MFHFTECADEKSLPTEIYNDLCKIIDDIKQNKKYIRLAIATGNTFMPLFSLMISGNIPLEIIDLYLIDEYVGLPYSDSLSCTYDIYEVLGATINRFHSIKLFTPEHYMEEIEQYNDELDQEGLDFCLLGVGNDGHVGFCYPPVPQIGMQHYNIIKLSDKQKSYHVAMGWFDKHADVPDEVISLTIYGMLKARHLLIGAAYRNKESTIRHMKSLDISSRMCPVLYLKNHLHATVYLG